MSRARNSGRAITIRIPQWKILRPSQFPELSPSVRTIRKYQCTLTVLMIFCPSHVFPSFTFVSLADSFRFDPHLRSYIAHHVPFVESHVPNRFFLSSTLDSPCFLFQLKMASARRDKIEKKLSRLLHKGCNLRMTISSRMAEFYWIPRCITLHLYTIP